MDARPLDPALTPGPPARGPWTDPLACALVALLALLAFANSVGGAFVYDDHQQIVDNPSIRPGADPVRALTSSVWAFRAEEGTYSSNYWRPAFVAWMIVNHRLFGADDPASARAWRIALLLLHAICSALVYLFARRLGLGPPLAFGAGAAFAVHPTNTESVAWISGAPSVLATLFMLGAWLLFTLREGRTGAIRWTAALALHALALGSKEIALLFPLVVLVTVWSRTPEREPSLRRALLRAAPFAALGVAYLLARHAVLSGRQPVVLGGAGATEVVLTAPTLVAFYVRQALWPVGVSPIHPIGAVSPSSIGWSTLWAPAALCVLGLACATWLAARSAASRVGLAWTIAALAPVFSIAAMQPEELAHDRYLYPALPGIVVVIAIALRWALSRAPSLTPRAACLSTSAILLACAIAMLPLTLRYNRAWTSDLALWQWGAEACPSSPSALARCATLTAAAGDDRTALHLFNQSIGLGRTKLADTGRAALMARLGRKDEAIAVMQSAIALYPPDRRMHELLCALLEADRRYSDLARAAESARGLFPGHRVQFTGFLAAGIAGEVDLPRAVGNSVERNLEEAARELESVRADAARSADPKITALLLRLGLVYESLGRPDDARAALAQHLEATAQFNDPLTLRARAEAAAVLRRLQWR